jgi:hypothetical protein
VLVPKNSQAFGGIGHGIPVFSQSNENDSGFQMTTNSIEFSINNSTFLNFSFAVHVEEGHEDSYGHENPCVLSDGKQLVHTTPRASVARPKVKQYHNMRQWQDCW